MGMYVQTKNLGQIDPVTATLIAQQGGDLLQRLFAGDPRKGRDTQKVEELNRFLTVIFDNARFTLGKPIPADSMSFRFGFPRSQLEQRISPGQAQELISMVQQANQQVLSSYERPESASNFTHTTMVPALLGMLNQIAAQGGGAGDVLAPISRAVGTDVSKLLPWGVAAAGLYFLS